MDKKKSRQYHLHRILQQNHYPISISELCRQLETSDKTLYRDIQEFRDSYHAPIVLEKGHLSYDKTCPHNFELPGIWFTDNELQALLAAQQLLSQIQPGLLDQHITPLKQFITDMLSQHGHPPDHALQRIKILGIGQRNSQPQHFVKTAGAVLDRYQCQLDYIDRKTGQISQRMISPQHLIFYRNNWYLDAWCHLKKALRTFSLDNIQTITPLEDPAKEIPETQRTEYFTSAFGIFFGKADKTAVLQFTGISARYIEKEQWHPEQQGEWQNDVYILSIPYLEPTELIMDILKYGADVKVLQPDSLKQAVIEKINKMAEHYKNK